MNRRSFFTKLGLAAASFAILPSAATYARKWVAPTAQCAMWVPNPAWETAPFEMSYLHAISTFNYVQSPHVMPIIRFTKERGEFVQVPQLIKA